MEEQKTEQSNISAEVKKSLEAMQYETPKNIEKKADALGVRELIEASHPQMLSIYTHFSAIGADSQLLTNKKEYNRAILQKWYQTLVIQNKRFPMDLPIVFVLDEFFNAILQRQVDLKGYNLLAHITAFHEFIEKYNHTIRSKHWAKMNFKDRPLELKPAFEKSEAQKEVDDERVAESIRIMYGKEVPESLKRFLKD